MTSDPPMWRESRRSHSITRSRTDLWFSQIMLGCCPVSTGRGMLSQAKEKPALRGEGRGLLVALDPHWRFVGEDGRQCSVQLTCAELSSPVKARPQGSNEMELDHE